MPSTFVLRCSAFSFVANFCLCSCRSSMLAGAAAGRLGGGHSLLHRHGRPPMAPHKRPLMRGWRRLAPPVILITADAVHGVVLEAFPADRASILICTPCVPPPIISLRLPWPSLRHHQCNFFFARGGLRPLVRSAGVPSLSFSVGWVFSTHWPSSLTPTSRVAVGPSLNPQSPSQPASCHPAQPCHDPDLLQNLETRVPHRNK